MMFEENKSLKDYTSFAVDVHARYFASFSSAQELKEIIASQEWKEYKHYVLGGGSNVLFTQDFDGVVIKSEIFGIDVLDSDDDTVRVKVGAAENWHEFVLFAAEHNYWGIENLALIPGTVGAAPVQNIGAYGVEVQECIESVEVFDMQKGEVYSITHDECHFAYRSSIFKEEKGRYLVLSVTFKLSLDGSAVTHYGSLASELEKRGISDPSVSDMVDIVTSVRQSKLPNVGDIGMAGSFFKNPVVSEEQYMLLKEKYPELPSFDLGEGKVKIPAAWLIETLGYKGIREGDVGTYDKHALVIVNHGNADGSEVWAFAQKIMKDVQEHFGIELEPEVLII